MYRHFVPPISYIVMEFSVTFVYTCMNLNLNQNKDQTTTFPSLFLNIEVYWQFIYANHLNCCIEI